MSTTLRIAAAMNTGEIMVIESGTIGEWGRHDDVIASDGHYAKPWRVQKSRRHRDGVGASVGQQACPIDAMGAIGASIQKRVGRPS